MKKWMKCICMLTAFAVALSIAGCGGDDDEKTKNVPVTQIQIRMSDGSTPPNPVAVDPNTYIQFNVNALPENATDKRLEWSSENTSIATVNASGLVQALNTGETKINCKALDGSNVSASVNLKVNEVDYGKEVVAVYEGKIDIKTGEMFYIDFLIDLQYVSVNKVKFTGEGLFPAESFSDDATYRAMIELGMIPSHIPVGISAELNIDTDGAGGYLITGGGNITLPEEFALGVLGLPMAGSTFTVKPEEGASVTESPLPYIKSNGDMYMRFEIFGLGEAFYNGKKK